MQEPDRYGLTDEYLNLIDESIRQTFAQGGEVPEFQTPATADELYVKLINEGDESIPADFGEAMPYTAKTVIYNKTTREWEDAQPLYLFDPDATPGAGVIPLYVYEVNGTIGLQGTVHKIRLQSFKRGTGDLYWSFSINGESQFAEIQLEESGPTYRAYQLDENLSQTGKLYGIEFPALIPLNGTSGIENGTIVPVHKKRDKFYIYDIKVEEDIIAELTGEASTAGTYNGNTLDGDLNPVPGKVFGTDLPALIELSGREKLGNERVLVHKVKDALGDDQYFFRWDDPIHEMGPEGSPPSDANGSYLAFFKDAGTTLGIDRGFDPDDGKYKHNRLIAIGASSGSSGSGQATGVKITPLDDYNYQIELVDETGTPVNPTVPPQPNPNNLEYCSKLKFNQNDRMLTIETYSIDNMAVEVLVCTNRVNIPCCEGGGGGGDDPDYPEDPDYPPTIPPDDPTDEPYEDPCSPPQVTCRQLEPICLPNVNHEIVSRVNTNLNGAAAGEFTYVLDEVKGPEGVVPLVNWRFSVNDGTLATDNNYALQVGTYTVTRTIQNTNSNPDCDWSDYPVVCTFTVKDCECDEDDTEEDETTSNCPQDCSDTQLGLEFEEGACVQLGGELENDSGREATISINMNLSYQSRLRSGRRLSDPNRPGETNRARPLHEYSKRVVYNDAFVIDADRSFRKTVPVAIQPLSRTNSGRRQAVANGRLDIRYIAFPEGDERLLVKYIDGFSHICPVAKDGAPGTYEKHDDPIGNGSIIASLDISEPDESEGELVGNVKITDPCDEFWNFFISGGADAASFTIKNIDGKSAEVRQKIGINFVNPNYTIEITADRISDGCQKVDTFIIAQCSVFDGVDSAPVRQTGGAPQTATAAGRRGETVTTFRATNASAVVPSIEGGNVTNWQIVSQKKRNDNATEMPQGSELFNFITYNNGEADLVVNDDLQAGTYEFTYQVQNPQMRNLGQFLEETFTVTIDKATGPYEKTNLFSSNGDNGGLT